MTDGTTASQPLTDLDYLRYRPLLYKRAKRITGEPEEALDILQSTFESFMEMQKRGILRGEAAPYTVLFTIVTNKSMDWLRKRARYTGKLELRDDENFENTEFNPAIATYPGDLNRVEAAQDLALLTQGEKPQVLTAAYLYFVEGNSAKQVGQSLNLSRQIVAEMLKQFVKRARARRARFEPSGPEVSP
jgi:RNA polymerase sigma-70 factor (ECF subfamily)